MSRIPRNQHEPRNLVGYIAYALLLHTLFLGLSAFRHKPPAESDPPVNSTVLEIEPPLATPPPPKAAPTPPALPIEKEVTTKPTAPAPSEPPSAPRAAKSVAPRNTLPDVQPSVPGDSPEGESPPNLPQEADRSEVPIVLPPGSPIAPRKSIGAITREAAERNMGSPRSGAEKRRLDDLNQSGVPVVAGGPWGSAKRGALKGDLCFIPAETRRLSDLTRCRAEGRIFTNVLNVTPRPFTAGFPGVSHRSEWFAIDFRGKFLVSRPGLYRFRLHSDDGSILEIDGKKLIDNDGQHPPQSKFGSVHLAEGSHRIRVFYFQGPRTYVALQLFVTPPDSAERLFSPKLE